MQFGKEDFSGMYEMNELSAEALDEVTGGKISFDKRPDRPGWIQHKVTASDTLIKIAKRYCISDWRKIREWNPHINHKTNVSSYRLSMTAVFVCSS